MPKKLAIVHPTVHLVKDDQGNTIRSDYSYPPAPSCKCEVIVYQRDGADAFGGDFIQEQIWTIEGPQESLDIFFADPRTSEITQSDCCQMGPQWDGPKEIEDRATPGARVVCPDCGVELACPDCGPMTGKTPKMLRQRKGWDPQDHMHHFLDLDENKHPKP